MLLCSPKAFSCLTIFKCKEILGTTVLFDYSQTLVGAAVQIYTNPELVKPWLIIITNTFVDKALLEYYISCQLLKRESYYWFFYIRMECKLLIRRDLTWFYLRPWQECFSKTKTNEVNVGSWFSVQRRIDKDWNLALPESFIRHRVSVQWYIHYW